MSRPSKIPRLQALDTKVKKLSLRLDLISAWLFEEFGNRQSFPLELKQSINLHKETKEADCKESESELYDTITTNTVLIKPDPITVNFFNENEPEQQQQQNSELNIFENAKEKNDDENAHVEELQILDPLEVASININDSCSHSVTKRKKRKLVNAKDLDFTEAQNPRTTVKTIESSNNSNNNCCSGCQPPFFRIPQKIIHLDNVKRYKCFILFKEEDQLKIHIKYGHPKYDSDPKSKQQFFCVYCNLKFSGKTTLTLHFSRNYCLIRKGMIEGTGPFKCDKCDSIFGQAESSEAHRNTVHPNENTLKPFIYTCKLCNPNQYFGLKAGLDKHCRRIHVHVPQLEEDKAKKSTPNQLKFLSANKVDLPQQQQPNYGLNILVQKEVSKNFEELQVLDQQQQQPNLGLTAQIQKDDGENSGFEELEVLDPLAPEPEVISETGNFAKKPKLDTNIHNHNTTTTATKTTEPKIFSYNKNPTIIYPPIPPRPQSSSNINQLKCDFCPRTFGQVSTMALHQNQNHLDQVSYKCHKCCMLFREEDQLNLHIKNFHPPNSEDSKKPQLRCVFCNKLFLGKQHLNRHIRQSCPVRKAVLEVRGPYKCDKCDDVFDQLSSLEAHRSTVHSAQRAKRLHTVDYTCKICNQSFNLKREFDNHNIEIHSSPLTVTSSKHRKTY